MDHDISNTIVLDLYLCSKLEKLTNTNFKLRECVSYLNFLKNIIFSNYIKVW